MKKLLMTTAILTGLASPAMALGDTAIILSFHRQSRRYFRVGALGLIEADLALSNIGEVSITASSVQRKPAHRT